VCLSFLFDASAMHGAELLLLKSPDAARFLVNAAFDRQRRGKQLVSTSEASTKLCLSCLSLSSGFSDG